MSFIFQTLEIFDSGSSKFKTRVQIYEKNMILKELCKQVFFNVITTYSGLILKLKQSGLTKCLTCLCCLLKLKFLEHRRVLRQIAL